MAFQTYRYTPDEIGELNAEIDRLRAAIAAIQKATVEGRVCDDVAWFDTITTLYDFCDQALNPPGASGQNEAGSDK